MRTMLMLLVASQVAVAAPMRATRIVAQEDTAEAPKTKTIRTWSIVLKSKGSSYGQPLVPMTPYVKAVLESLDPKQTYTCEMDTYDNNIVGLGGYWGAFTQVFDMGSCKAE